MARTGAMAPGPSGRTGLDHQPRAGRERLPSTGGRRLLNRVTSLLDVVVVRDQNWYLSPNCMMRGSAAVRICPNVALLSVVFGLPGRSQLRALNASTRASTR